MDFKTFKANVERWAEVRGIYEQSTESHQKAKALEEIGEYLTAKTDEERMDAIGDIAVCVVNSMKLANFDDFEYITLMYFADLKDNRIAGCAYNIVNGRYKTAIRYLISECYKFNFLDCLEMAWNSIKDRNGMMVNGFYVKWDNLTEEQREEFRLRDVNNTLLTDH